MDAAKIELEKSLTTISDCLIISLSAELADEDLAYLSERAPQKAAKYNTTCALLNFSRVSTMDASAFLILSQLSGVLKLMGLNIMWAGLTPGVVCAMADLNLEIDEKIISTALDMNTGLAMLSAFKGR